MKKILLGMVMLLVLALPVMGQTQEDKAGTTPDSPWYFMDRMFDGLQSAEKVQNEKAAEIEVMAEKGNQKATEKAVKAYEKSSERARKRIGNDPNRAEEAARQTSKHLSRFAALEENTSEQTRGALERAMNISASNRGRAISAINRTDPVRAESVAESTLMGVMNRTPEQAQKGLSNALGNVRREHKRDREDMDNRTEDRRQERNRTKREEMENRTPENEDREEGEERQPIDNRSDNETPMGVN